MPREGWRGRGSRGTGRGGEGRSTVSIIHAEVDEGRDPCRISGLGPSGLPSIMLEAILTRRKGWPRGGPVYGRLLNFLEGASGWKEARNPSLSKLPCTLQSDCTEPPLLAEGTEAPLPVYSESVFANIFCF